MILQFKFREKLYQHFSKNFLKWSITCFFIRYVVCPQQWFNLWYFDITLVWKWYAFSRNCASYFKFGSFLGQRCVYLSSLLRLGPGQPHHHQGEQRYICKLSAPRQPSPYVFHCQYSIQWGFLGGSGLKKLPANAENVGSIPGSGRSPGGGNGNPLQYSCLKISTDRGALQDIVHGVAKSQFLLSDWVRMQAQYSVNYMRYIQLFILN